MNDLGTLVRTFAYLSVVTFGGGMAAFPELKTLTVDVHHWMDFQHLIHLYSVGQLSPGPNMMVVAAIGEQVAGPAGAIAVVLAYFVPTILITFAMGRLWDRLEGWPWRESIQKGLAPVAIGLVLAGSITMAKGALFGWHSIAIAIAVFAILLLTTRINPAYLVLSGALVGLVVFGPTP